MAGRTPMEGSPYGGLAPGAEAVYFEVIEEARRFLQQHCRSADPDDLVQDIALSLLQEWSDPATFVPPRNVKRYALRAARTRLVDALRVVRAAKRGGGAEHVPLTRVRPSRNIEDPDAEEEIDEPVSPDDPEAAFHERELRAMLPRVLARMPRDRRSDLERMKDDDASYRAIAAERGVKERTVRNNVVNAMRDIRDAFDRHMGNR